MVCHTGVAISTNSQPDQVAARNRPQAFAVPAERTSFVPTVVDRGHNPEPVAQLDNPIHRQRRTLVNGRHDTFLSRTTGRWVDAVLEGVGVRPVIVLSWFGCHRTASTTYNYGFLTVRGQVPYRHSVKHTLSEFVVGSGPPPAAPGPGSTYDLSRPRPANSRRTASAFSAGDSGSVAIIARAAAKSASASPVLPVSAFGVQAGVQAFAGGAVSSCECCDLESAANWFGTKRSVVQIHSPRLGITPADSASCGDPSSRRAAVT